MKDSNETIWFPAKKDGIGWGPPTVWQGWAVLLSYILLIVIGAVTLTKSPGTMQYFYIYAGVLTALLIFICWKKGG